MAVAVSDRRKARLAALHELHSAFVADNLGAPFDPSGRPVGSDYNQHHVDLEADPDAQWAFHQRGLAIVRGDLDTELGIGPAAT